MSLTRRDALKTAGAAALGAALAGRPASAREKAVKNGRLKQSVCRWCYQRIPLEDFLAQVAAMGLPAVDLLQPEEFEAAARHGLTVSTGYPGKGGGTIPDGLNNAALHDQIYAAFKQGIPRAKAAKVPNLITFFGNRKGMPDEQAIENSAAILNRIKPIAEDHGVTVVVELLNSKVNHPDYHGDRTWFGVEVMKRVNSPHVKLLYDIYHMQIMEGDIIRTIQDNKQWIGHYHTGGNPGRHELDDTQELQWATIAKAILDTGYTGYFAHEFIPTRDPMTSLREAVVLCDV
ncbi:MAG TPA: TIM barrel protein [Vicinamibacterales bacterium]